jgi:hypothetical protein
LDYGERRCQSKAANAMTEMQNVRSDIRGPQECLWYGRAGDSCEESLPLWPAHTTATPCMFIFTGIRAEPYGRIG